MVGFSSLLELQQSLENILVGLAADSTGKTVSRKFMAAVPKFNCVSAVARFIRFIPLLVEGVRLSSEQQLNCSSVSCKVMPQLL